MPEETEILAILAALEASAPSGFALAFHIKYSAPAIMLQTYPKEWTDHYSQNGLVMSDPTVAWGFQNVGTIRWSELTDQDTTQVMSQSADFGLAYGAAFALESCDSRSLGSIARADREFTDSEIAEFFNRVSTLHQLTLDHRSFSPKTMRQLQTMSVELTHSDKP